MTMRSFSVVLIGWFLMISCKSEPQTLRVISLEEFQSVMKEARQSDDLTVYNFWATWCAPCVAEMPIIAEFTRTHGQQLIFVNVDRQNLWESRVPQMLKKLNLQEEVYLLDKPKLNNWYQMIDENWGAGLPVTLFVGQGQSVLFQGPLEEKDLKEITGKFNKDY